MLVYATATNGTTGTTTLTYDVSGDATGAYLWQDRGTGAYLPLNQGHKLYGAGSERQTVYYNNGQPTFFAFSLDSPATRYSPVIEVDVQQQPQQACPSPPPPPSTLTLPGTKFVSSVKTYSHNSADAWCGGVPPFGGGALYDHGTAPDYDVTALGNRLAVGYIHSLTVAPTRYRAVRRGTSSTGAGSASTPPPSTRSSGTTASARPR